MIKPFYMVGALLVLLYWRHHNDAAHSGITKTAESIPLDGTNFQSDLWGVLSGAKLASPNFPNLIAGSPNADPGGNAAANLKLMPGWDGSLS